MIKKILNFICAASFMLTPWYAIASGTGGIPTDLIWFSKYPFYAGETIHVYTVIYNSTLYQLTGTVELRDSEKVIGKRDFIIGPSGASDVIGIPWNVSIGEHNLGMYVTNSTFTFAGKQVPDTHVTSVNTKRVEVYAEQAPAASSRALGVAASPSSPASASSSLISSVGAKVVDRIPEPVVANAVPVFGHLEDFRRSQAVTAETIIRNAETSILAASGTSTKKVATSTAPYLDKWGGVIDPTTIATTTKERSDMRGWDLVLHGTSGADLMRTPFQYVKLFFTLVFSFIVNHAWIFYIVLLLLIFKIVRLVLGIFF